jgi:serine/threonine-protein kinase SRPK1
VLICVDEAYIRKIAVEANEMVSTGMKLPTSLISTAPEEFQPQVPTGKLSKTKKKKLKKKAKLQNELIRMQMEHLQQTEPESKGTKDGVVDGENASVTATLSNNDESPTDNDTSSHIMNGSMKSNASSENENDDKEKSNHNMNTSVKSNDESNEDNEDVDKMSNSSPSERVIDAVPIIQSPPIENGIGEHLKRSPKPATSPLDPTFDICDFEVKIADLGNACWVDKHFTEGEFVFLLESYKSLECS